MNNLPINQIICGDCLEVMKDFPDFIDTIVTDPIWPDSTANIPNSDCAYDMWQWFLPLIPASTKRLAVHLGCDSDPEFLKNTKKRFKFFRVCWLEYVRPHYVGRLMYGSDVAYLYGEPPKSKPGQHVIPGRFTDADSQGKQNEHPCPKKIAHVEWLIKWWTEPNDVVLDPFCGSGTTCVAAKKLGRRYIGIDISEEYCQIARERLRAIETGVPVKEARAGQKALFE